MTHVDVSWCELGWEHTYVCLQQGDVPFIQSCEDENNMNEFALSVSGPVALLSNWPMQFISPWLHISKELQTPNMLHLSNRNSPHTSGK